MMPAHVPIIRIFISSPSDVNDERKIALDVIEQFPYRPVFRGKVAFQVVAWDKPGAGTPMRGTLTPQEAINQGLPKPSECDFVIVLLWSRMGTQFTDVDGTEYLSGTHWELMDGLNSNTETLIYRRTEEKLFRADEKDNVAQFERVQEFFESELFYQKDGSILRGVNQYDTPEDFRLAFNIDLEVMVLTILSGIEKQILTLAKDHTSSKVDGKNVVEIQPIKWDIEKSPFPGLRSFREDDANIFFGRGRETDALIKQVSENAFVAVVGASGSGKSSLVRAGLIARLRQGAIEGSQTWDIVDFTPGDHAFKSLTNALMATLPTLAPQSDRTFARELDEFTQDLETGVDRLRNTLNRILSDAPEHKKIFLFIDQFEELFTLTPPVLRGQFIATLANVLRQSQIQVVVTLRADFYHQVMKYPELAELLNDGNFNLIAPRRDALRDMIERPADRSGLDIETGLVNTILNDTGDEPGNLALMAYLLDELYEVCKFKGELTQEAYDDLGGVEGAIGKRAENVFVKIKGDKGDKIRAIHFIFPELVDVDDEGNATRRRYTYVADNESELVQMMVSDLVGARLLTSDFGVLEVAHEALLREWKRLAQWIDREQDNLRLRRQLLNDARNWEHNNRSQDLLYRGGILEEAQNFIDQNPQIESLAIEYIKKAKARSEKEDKQRKRLIAFLVVGILLTSSLAMLSLYGFENASSQRQRADFNVTEAIAAYATSEYQRIVNLSINAQLLVESQLALEAELLFPDNPTLALALAIEASNVPSPPIVVQRVLASVAYESRIRREFRGHSDIVRSVAFSPNGDYVISGAEDGTIILWDISDGQKLHTFAGHSESVTAVDINRKSDLMVSASRSGQILLWNINKKSLVGEFNVHNGTVTDIQFSPTGGRIISSSLDGTVIVLDTALGQEIHRLYHESPVQSIAYSPNSETIASGLSNGEIVIWDANSENIITTMVVHEEKTIWSLVYSPDNSLLVTGSEDASIAIIDTQNWIEIERLWGHDISPVLSVEFDNDMNLASASVDRSIVIWERQNDSFNIINRFIGHTRSVLDLSFSPDSSRLLSASEDQLIILWDLFNGAEKTKIRYENTSHVDNIVSIPETSSLAIGLDGGQIGIWNYEDETSFSLDSSHNSRVSTIAISSSGDLIASGSTDSTIQIWNRNAGEIVWHKIGHGDQVTSINFSPNNEIIITGSESGNVALWDVVNGEEMARFNAHDSRVTGSVFLSKSNNIITASFDQTIKIWDAQSLELKQELVGHTDWVTDIAVSVDEHLLISGSADESIIIWDLNTHSVVHQLYGHRGIVSSVAISPDSQIMASGSFDKNLFLWDISTGTLLRRYNGHEDWIVDITFINGGHAIASSGWTDRTIRIWRIHSLDELLKWIKNNRAVLPLSCDEKQNYQVLPLCT